MTWKFKFVKVDKPNDLQIENAKSVINKMLDACPKEFSDFKINESQHEILGGGLPRSFVVNLLIGGFLAKGHLPYEV